MIQTNPGLVKRFVKATLDGLKAAIADPQQAGEILHKYQRGIDVAIAVGETRKVKELAVQPNVPLGTIDPARVQKTIDTVAATFQLKSKVSPADVYAPGLLPE
jgi:NitT/TauT family transport system substrate-binding protein